MSSGSQGRIFPLKYFKHSRPSSLFFLIPTLTFHPQFFLGKPFLERTLAVDVESKDHGIFQEIVVGEAEQWKLDATAGSCIGNRLNTSPVRRWLRGRNAPREECIGWLAEELRPCLSSPLPSCQWLTELPLLMTWSWMGERMYWITCDTITSKGDIVESPGPKFSWRGAGLERLSLLKWKAKQNKKKDLRFELSK